MFNSGDGNVSFVIPRTSGGYVIGHDQAIKFLDWDQEAKTTIVATLDQGTTNRLNDAKCDASGRLWAGEYHVPYDPYLY